MILKERYYKNMNLPNILTVSRVFLAVIFALFFQAAGAGGALAALLVFALAALTDFADGYIARKYGLVTTFGKILDPIADKLLILTAFFMFAFEGQIALWMAAAVACREISVTAARIHLLTSGKVVPAESAGKVKTAVQMAVVVLVLVYRLAEDLPVTQVWIKDHQSLLSSFISGIMMIAVILTVWSGWEFFRKSAARERGML